MELLEARAVLEDKYPDWHEDADQAFEELELETERSAHAIACEVAKAAHPDRHAKLSTYNKLCSDARVADFDAWVKSRGELGAA